MAWMLMGLMLACSDPPDDSVLASQVANEVGTNPQAAEAVLAKHGLTFDAFSALLYDVAEDPKKTRAYLDRLK